MAPRARVTGIDARAGEGGKLQCVDRSKPWRHACPTRARGGGAWRCAADGDAAHCCDLPRIAQPRRERGAGMGGLQQQRSFGASAAGRGVPGRCCASAGRAQRRRPPVPAGHGLVQSQRVRWQPRQRRGLPTRRGGAARRSEAGQAFACSPEPRRRAGGARRHTGRGGDGRCVEECVCVVRPGRAAARARPVHAQGRVAAGAGTAAAAAAAAATHPMLCGMQRRLPLLAGGYVYVRQPRAHRRDLPCRRWERRRRRATSAQTPRGRAWLGFGGEVVFFFSFSRSSS